MKFSRLIVLFVVVLNINFLNAQSSKLDSLVADTLAVKVDKPHSPTKATVLSAVIPGSGQIYNKKYWKAPIVYASIGTSLYFALYNHKYFKEFKEAYLIRIDGDVSTIDEYADVLSEDGLRANMDYHQRNRDLSYVFVGLFYVLNIVDAAVDAHLFNFPKNDKLSFNLQPSIELTANNQVNRGFKLVINL